jgi:pilus assembly protein Flp/PilA
VPGLFYFPPVQLSKKEIAMKKITVLLLVVILSLMVVTPVLAAGMRQEGTPTSTLPDWAVALLKAGAIWLVTAGLKSISKALPFVTTLEGPATAAAGAIVALIVVFGNGLLGMIPATYQPAVIAVFGFIGTLLSAYGVQGTLKMFHPSPTQVDETERDPELEQGQGMVEYALILVLVAVVVIAALTIMGPLVKNVFETINSSL